MRPLNLSGAPRAIVDAASESLQIRCVDAKDAEPAELLIMENIGEDWYGDGVSATSVVDFVANQKDSPIHVRINSPGGFVYDGLVMYNALASHVPDVTVTVEGLAYSMASVIALAGDTVRMFKASDYGIHRAWGGAVGNQNEMRAAAEWLAKIDDHLAEIYAEKTGKPAAQIIAWMEGTSDGTLFSATEALEAGFADEVIDPKGDQDKGGKRAKAKAAGSLGRSQLQAAKNRLRMLKTT